MRSLTATSIGVTLLVSAAAFHAATASAAEGDGKPPTVTATVSSSTTIVDEPDPPPVIPCNWNFPPSSEEHADVLNVITELVVVILNPFGGQNRQVTVVYFYDEARLQRWSETRAQFESVQVADCTFATHPGGVSDGDVRWIIVDPPDPRILVGTATETATEPITFPAPRISPADDAPVNLGLWLAVEPVGPIVARAVLGPLWAETTAALETTTFDPGNGDPIITCDGHGTPLPDGEDDTVEQGPCGYTYRESAGDDPVTMTITSTWTVTWELSDGRTGREPDIVVTTLHPFQVYEIQTVGVDN